MATQLAHIQRRADHVWGGFNYSWSKHPALQLNSSEKIAGHWVNWTMSHQTQIECSNAAMPTKIGAKRMNRMWDITTSAIKVMISMRDVYSSYIHRDNNMIDTHRYSRWLQVSPIHSSTKEAWTQSQPSARYFAPLGSCSNAFIHTHVKVTCVSVSVCRHSKVHNKWMIQILSAFAWYSHNNDRLNLLSAWCSY